MMIGCGSTAPPSRFARSKIPEPEFIAGRVIADSASSSRVSRYFYQYQFDSKEDDVRISPEWMLANLYSSGVKVIEAWYTNSTTPSSHRDFTTGTVYGPYFVVGLADEDNYMEHLRYHKLGTFDSVEVSKGFLWGLMHYVSR